MRQLSLLEPPVPQSHNDVWITLTHEQRNLVLDMLARLIARVIAAQTHPNPVAHTERRHE